jgi:metal-responsive CopG/Arc/MetJ family transcriptional regulator
VNDKVTIKIPRTLYNSLKKQINETGFNSVTDFIVYLLRDIVASGRVDKDIALTKEEIGLIKKRLKTLGYL